MTKTQQVALAKEPKKQMTLAASGFDPSKGSLTTQRLFDSGLNDRVCQLAKELASSPVAPKHAKNNMILMNWVIEMHLNTGVPPMALINGTFDPGGGILGMTAQLCLTLLQSTRSIKCEPKWELIGDWSKVRGKFIIKEGKSKENKDYRFPEKSYTAKDEEGLGVRLIIHWANQETPTTYPEAVDEDGKSDAYWMLACHPRNSPLWVTDPLQQMKYYVLRLVTRTARPAALNGMPVGDDDWVHHRGPDNARPINAEPMTAEDALDEMADDFDEAEAGNYDGEIIDEYGEVHNDPPPADDKVLVWLNFENPSFPVDKDKLENTIGVALSKAEDMTKLLALMNNNSMVLKNHLDDNARARLNAAQTKRGDELS